MDETDMQPTPDQQGLAFHDGLKQRQASTFRVSGIGEVTIDYIAGEAFNGFHVASRGEILEGSDADVTRCDAGQHGPRQLAIAVDRFAG
jgi:hypothetical protein